MLGNELGDGFWNHEFFSTILKVKRILDFIRVPLLNTNFVGFVLHEYDFIEVFPRGMKFFSFRWYYLVFTTEMVENMY